MDSARFILAIVLMIAVIFLTNLLFPPPKRPAKGPAEATAPSAVPAGSVAATASRATAPPPAPPAPQESTATAAPASTPAAPAAQPVLRAAPAVIVESPLYRYAISRLGGAITSAELLEYKSFTREGPVQLVADDMGPLVSYRVRVGTRVVDLRNADFQVQGRNPAADSPAVSPLTLEVAGGQAPVTVRMVHRDTAYSAELDYTFAPDRYLVQVRGRIQVAGESGPEVLIDLGPTLATNEAEPAEDYRSLAYVVDNTLNGIDSRSLDKVKEQQIEEGPLAWVAVKNKYFLLAALAPSDSASHAFGGLIARPFGAPHAALLTATIPASAGGGFAYDLYMGPQEYNRLAAIDRDIQDVNPYGWRFLRPVIRPLAHVITWAVLAMHRILAVGYGWILILFGVLVRLLLWPLNAKAMRSQLKNMELQPRIKEIQEKYKNEPEKLQKEMLRLYKEEGFNPLGGCLPMLIPFPVLITLYYVFQATIEFRGVPFLWLPDLARADPLYILPILLGVSMFALQWLGTRTTQQSNPQMKMMMYFMPIFMTVIFLKLASGLNLYYAASNIASIPQQIQIVRERAAIQNRRT